MNIDYLVIDCETSINNRGEGAIGKQQAHWRHPDNQIVMWGGYDGEEYTCIKRPLDVSSDYVLKRNVLIGHNIRFDLHYFLKTYPWFAAWLENPDNMIWDTQLVEYLLTGQEAVMVSLDKASEKYGGTLKDDRIKAFWEEGVATEDIPKDLLADYLKHDVLNTHLVFKEQLNRVQELNMASLVRTQLKALVATLEMEHNGMCFKVGKALQYAAIDNELLAKFTHKLTQRMYERHPALDNPHSPKQVSVYLFGGEVSWKQEEPVQDETGEPVRYKSGKRKGEIKTKKVTRTAMLQPMVKPSPAWGTATPGYYSVDDKTLDKAVMKSKEPRVRNFVSDIKQLRALNKDITTYYIGYSKLAWRDHAHLQDYIHGQLNHCITATGRLSSSQPNLQNLSGKER